MHTEAALMPEVTPLAQALVYPSKTRRSVTNNAYIPDRALTWSLQSGARLSVILSLRD